MSIFGGVIWHYWLAVPLVVVGVVSLIAALVGYLGESFLHALSQTITFQEFCGA